MTVLYSTPVVAVVGVGAVVGTLVSIPGLDTGFYQFCSAQGVIYGNQSGKVIAVEGLGSSVRQAAAEFSANTLQPPLASVLPRGVLEIIAAYSVGCCY